MVDFNQLLQRAVDQTTTADERREVYAKAREALVSSLRKAGALPAEITRQRLALKEAIRGVEDAAAERLKQPT